MRYQKTIAPMILILFFVFSWPFSLPAAEQKAAVPKAAEQKAVVPKAAEKVSLTPGKPIPLQQPLQAGIAGPNFLCTNLVNTINGIIQIAHKDLYTSTKLYSEAGVHIPFPGIWELYYYKDVYRSKVQACCSDQKSFSIQEQQAAGCANSDTVEQCVGKLVKKCLVDLKPDELKGMLKQSQQKADVLSQQTRQLSDQLKNLISIMP
jgi:hypothetical protein